MFGLIYKLIKAATRSQVPNNQTSGMPTHGLQFMTMFLAVIVMYQVRLRRRRVTPSGRVGGKYVAIFGLRLVESRVAAFMLWWAVRQQDAIHVPSLFAVAVAKNKLGFSGKSQ